MISDERRRNLRILQLASQGKLTLKDLYQNDFGDFKITLHLDGPPKYTDEERIQRLKDVKAGKLILITLDLSQS